MEETKGVDGGGVEVVTWGTHCGGEVIAGLGCEIILQFYQEIWVFKLRALLWRLQFQVVLRFDDDCGQKMSGSAVCFAHVLCLLLHLLSRLLLSYLCLPPAVFPQNKWKGTLRLR